MMPVGIEFQSIARRKPSCAAWKLPLGDAPKRTQSAFPDENLKHAGLEISSGISALVHLGQFRVRRLDPCGFKLCNGTKLYQGAERNPYKANRSALSGLDGMAVDVDRP